MDCSVVIIVKPTRPRRDEWEVLDVREFAAVFWRVLQTSQTESECWPKLDDNMPPLKAINDQPTYQEFVDWSEICSNDL